MYPQIIRTADNGHIIFGRTSSDAYGNNDLMMIKADSKGNVLWAGHYGDEKRNLSKRVIRFENNYLFAGWLNQFAITDDLLFFIMDDNGNILRSKSWGLDGDDEIQGVDYMGNGKFGLAGETLSLGSGYTGDIFITTMNEDLELSGLTVYSHNDVLVPRQLKYTSDYSFFIVGFALSGGGATAFVLKSDTLGNIIWGYRFGDGSNTRLWNALEDNEENLVAVGHTNGYGAQSDDLLFVKFSPDGTLLAAKTIGSTGKEMGYGIINGHDGGYVVVGETTSFGNGGNDVMFLKLDNAGNFKKGFTYGGNEDEFYPAIDYNTADSGYCIVSETNSFNSDNSDYFLITTDNNGLSCCSNEITGISVKNINLPLLPTGFSKSHGNFEVRNHNINYSAYGMNTVNLCLDSVSIVGPDSLYCLDSAKYTIDPKVLIDVEWVVPPAATIVESDNDTAIVVDFANESGWIYLLSGFCPGDTLDSLYVTVTNGNAAPVNLGPDTSFCYGKSITLSPGSGYINYYWQDGSGDTVYVATRSGIYWVQVTDSAGCTASDTVTVETFMTFDFSIGNDTTICDGDYIFLNGPEGYASYLWQDGSGYNSFIADTAGIYWLEITDTNNCAARDSLLLQTDKVPAGILGTDTLMCKDSVKVLRTHPAFEQYFWQDGSQDSIYIASEPGKYWVMVFDTLGCSGSDTITLTYFPAVTLELKQEGYLCEDDSVLLTAISNYDSFIWQDSSTSSYFVAKDSGTYWVRATNGCETKRDTIIIDACSSIWIPNVFTPNNDGYNDYFYAVAKNISKFKIEIFNRWGQVLAVLNSIDEKWDGTYKGRPVAEGTYFWIADFEQINSRGVVEKKRLQGSLTLIK